MAMQRKEQQTTSDTGATAGSAADESINRQRTEIAGAPRRADLCANGAGTPAEPEQPLLDLDKLASRRGMGADSGFFEALVRGFQEDAEVAIADLAEALRSSDHSALRRAVHALEGSAGEVGAVRLVAAVRRLRGLRPCELESAGALALLAEVEQLLPMTLHLLEQAAAAASAQCEP